MKNKLIFKAYTIGLGVIAVLITSCEPINHTKNMTNLNPDQWVQSGEGIWTIDEGVITGNASLGEAYLMSQTLFKDFILTLEFKPDEKVNSGIYVRCLEQKGSAEECHEINIWDNHPIQKNRTGAIVNRVPPEQIMNTIGKWNTFKIKCIKDSIEVELNGNTISNFPTSPNQQGYIGLQAANKGIIQFRSINIQVLEDY